MDGSEARGSVNGSVLVKYGTYIGLARFTVWMPEFPLELSVPDVRLSQIKGWKVPDYHAGLGKTRKKKSTEVSGTTENNKSRKRRSYSIQDIPEDLSDEIYDDEEDDYEEIRQKRSDMIPDILEKIADDPNEKIRQKRSGDMIPDILEKITINRKKRSVATKKNFEGMIPDILEKFTDQHDPSIRRKRSFFPQNNFEGMIPDILEKIREDNEIPIRKKRSNFEGMIPDILEKINDEESLNPRQKRSKMIPDILEKLKEDQTSTKWRVKRSYWSPNIPEEFSNGVNERPPCRIRFQQSPVDVYAHFMATDHDSGRVTYFVNRRTWLRVTDLVLPLLRVSDPKIASLHGRILQGRFNGRAEVQVLSPITGRVIGAKEVRVSNDKVTINKLAVRVVSGLQLNISPDSSIENGYIAETSVTRRLTAQYQVSVSK